MSEVVHGACLCGRVHYEVHGPELMAACHCTRCQRWTGAAGSTVVIVDPKDFKVTKGQDVMKTFHEDGFATLGLCSNCGSGIYADGGKRCTWGRRPEGSETKIGLHIQVAHKAHWDEIGGSAKQFPEWPT